MMRFKLNNSKIFIIAILSTIIAAVIIFIGLYFGLGVSYSDAGAVVSNGIECAKIGTDVLKDGGSAADAAIATLFCEGVSCPESMGLGGGFLLTIYIRETKTTETLIAREVAPLAATEDMYVGFDQITDIIAAAVPGELKGYWELHKKYGKLPWRRLIQPTIDLCINGHRVTASLAGAMRGLVNRIHNNTELSDIFINPLTNNTWNEGDTMRRPQLAKTLEIIADEGADAIYNGSLTKAFVDDIQEMGGIMTIEDFNNYEVRWESPIVSHLKDNKTLYTIPLPGSGILLSFIMNILNEFIADDSIVTYQRIIEAFKYAYAKRTELGDPYFINNIEELITDLTDPIYAEEIRSLIDDTQTSTDPIYYGANFTNVEDQGTAHISVLAPNGDAVSVTSTVNTYFGCKRRSKSTGIILNDLMDDFSTPGITNAFGVPASPANFIVPGKRPMSSMTPTIIIDENDDVQLIIGAAGGTRITTIVAYTIIRFLWFNENLHDAVFANRIHHQLLPMYVLYERNLNETILNGLSNIGHEMVATGAIASLTAISIENNKINAEFDPRRGGNFSIYQARN